jgi:hypothetical protein
MNSTRIGMFDRGSHTPNACFGFPAPRPTCHRTAKSIRGLGFFALSLLSPRGRAQRPPSFFVQTVVTAGVGCAVPPHGVEPLDPMIIVLDERHHEWP